jgi:hypothetical protein
MIAILLNLLIILKIVKGEGDEMKMYFYERPEVPVDKQNQVDLFISITYYYLLSYKQLPFKFDFSSNEILLNSKNFDCIQKNYCVNQNNSNKDVYEKIYYDYSDIKTFVGIKKLSAGEITEVQAKTSSVANVRLMKDTALPNVLGVAPNSEFFSALGKEFYIKNSVLNITYCNYEDHEHFRVYSRIDENEVMVPIQKNEITYNFLANLKIDAFDTNAVVCVDNSNDKLFLLHSNIIQKLKGSLCKNPDKCNTTNDLVNTDFFVYITLSTKIPSSSDFKADIYYKDLYSIKGDEIIWNFDTIQDKLFSKCDIVLERAFFKKFYFLISKNLDTNTVNVGFRRILPSNFIINQLWKYMLILFVLSLFFLIGGNIILCIVRRKKQQKVINEEDYVILKKKLQDKNY